MFPVLCHRRIFKLPVRSKGFTLIEILVALSILGVLAALAAPSFTETIRRFRGEAIRDDLVASLQVARSEAITRSRSDTTRVTMARMPTSGPCTTATNGDWSCGWQIFQDNDNDQVFNNADVLIQQTDNRPGFSVSESSTTPANSIIANRWGQFSSANIFVIAPIISGTATPSAPSANAVCLGLGNRITQVKQSSGDVTCTP
jgi:type IV fimbrial biogenesis protein FimT